MTRGALLLAMLSGCTLVDQNTFNPGAGAAPVIAAAKQEAKPATVPGSPALLTIAADSAPAQVQEAVHRGVAAARARKPGVLFDVVELVPAGVLPGAGFGAQAGAVARAIVAEGVAAQRVTLVARPDAGAAPNEVRVYVR